MPFQLGIASTGKNMLRLWEKTFCEEERDPVADLIFLRSLFLEGIMEIYLCAKIAEVLFSLFTHMSQNRVLSKRCWLLYYPKTPQKEVPHLGENQDIDVDYCVLNYCSPLCHITRSYQWVLYFVLCKKYFLIHFFIILDNLQDCCLKEATGFSMFKLYIFSEWLQVAQFCPST